MACCANGPCNDSKERGGPGCHLCDYVAKLPQPGRVQDDQKPRGRTSVPKAPRRKKDQ